jgi:hypothetical protein
MVLSTAPLGYGRWVIRLRRCALTLVVLIALLGGCADSPSHAGAGVGVRSLFATSSAVRDRTAYAGRGAWVDGFDFGPAYTDGAPPVGPSVIDDMAAHGVKTLFLQAAREDTRSPGGLVDGPLVGSMLVRAHAAGLKVVAWYLPRFRDPALDLRNLIGLARFEVLGHRFDGVAVDIEFTDDVPDTAERNKRLIELSRGVRAELGTDALGAIVLPPVLTEVVNEQLWPEFPYAELSGLYDVWLPMSYWTFRTQSSGYKDGFTYNEESTRRLRADLGQPNAVVHGIGGIGDATTVEDLDRFGQSLVQSGSVGGSIYDWSSMSSSIRDAMAARFPALPPP